MVRPMETLVPSPVVAPPPVGGRDFWNDPSFWLCESREWGRLVRRRNPAEDRFMARRSASCALRSIDLNHRRAEAPT